MDAQLYGRQSSTRWIPTPEQIRILKDLYYNKGVRSPTSEQIQRISSKLRQYGKIEGKNVFYWFQNHKARERQKMKLAMEISNSNSTLTNLNDAYGFAADNSPVFFERNITEACFNGANAVEWEGCIIEHNVTMPWMYSYIQDDHNKFVSQSTRNIETLPLFPTHSQEEEEEEEEEEEKFGVAVTQSNYSNNNEYNYHMQPNNGYNMPAYYYNGNGADSLELTLNSYYCNRS